MKKIFILLLSFLAFNTYAQAEFPESVQLTNVLSTTAPFVNVQTATGVVNRINKADLIEYLEFASAINLPVTGVAGKLYLTLDNNLLYRWNGTIYVPMSSDVSGKEDVANKSSSFTASSTVTYANTKALVDGLAGKASNIPQLEFNATDLTVWNNGKGNASNNTSFGEFTLRLNNGGVGNTAIGTNALSTNVTGSSITAIGTDALSNINGSNNVTAIGGGAGKFFNVNSPLTSAISSIFIGGNSRALADSQINQIVIGVGAVGAGSNTATLGDTNITSTILRGAVSTNGSFINSTAPAGNVLLAGGGTLAQTGLPYLPLTGGTLTGALNGTMFNITTSDARFTGGNSVGRLLFGNSSTTAYAEFNGSASGTPDDINIISVGGRFRVFTNSTERFTIANGGAATFSSTVIASNATALNHLVTKAQTLYTNQTITANKTVAISEFVNNNELVLRVDATAGNITVTLPTFTALQGYKVTVRKVDNSANSVLIQSVGGINIDGASTLTVSGQYGKATVGADLVQYIIL